MQDNDLLRLSAQIVSAHVRHNKVNADELASFIHLVYKALYQAGAPTPMSETFIPAVPIKKSIYPGYIVCLEDGIKLKMLKRHLQISYGMTPGDYRAKWGLPDSYPMVAPEYSARRSAVAKENGLGRVTEKPAGGVPVQKFAVGVRGKKPVRKHAPTSDAEMVPEVNE